MHTLSRINILFPFYFLSFLFFLFSFPLILGFDIVFHYMVGEDRGE